MTDPLTTATPTSQEERTWALAAHLSALVGYVVVVLPASGLAEDLTGRGHQMRVIGDEPCVWMFVVLNPNAA